jgi:hypothetical protein
MRLEFGVGVRANFAVEVDLFVLRCGPFHGAAPLVLVMQDPHRVSQVIKEGNTATSRHKPPQNVCPPGKKLLHIDKIKRGNRSRSRWC